MKVEQSLVQMIRTKSDSTMLVAGITLQAMAPHYFGSALYSFPSEHQHSLSDWTALSAEWTLSTLTFNKNHSSSLLAILRPPSFALVSSMSSSNTSVYKQSFWHDCYASSKEICCCHATHQTYDCVNLVQQDFPNLHLSPQQFWQQPHSPLFEDGLPLSSCHYIKVLQFLFYHFLPLFELAPSSAQSSCTLSSTPSAACLHTSDKYQKEKEELIQRSS